MLARSKLSLAVALACLAGCASSPAAPAPEPDGRLSGRKAEESAPPVTVARAEESSSALSSEAASKLDAIAKDLGVRDQERRALAEHYFKVGKVLYDRFEYREAAKNFEIALEADPNDATTRNYLDRAGLLAGDRQPEYRCLVELLHDQRLASIDQQRIEVQRLEAEGERLLAAHEWKAAIERFEVVLEKLRWFPYSVEEPGLEQKTRARLVEAKKKKRDQVEKDRIDREERALRQAREAESSGVERRRATLAAILRDGKQALEGERFGEAEASFALALERDPRSADARTLLDAAREGARRKRAGELAAASRRESARDDAEAEAAAVPSVPANRTASFPGE